jgi:ribosomal-protein-serine acetyltransferase
MFAYRIDDDLELRMLEERHAQELFEVIDRDREDLRTWLPWVDGSRSADDITAFIRSAGQELAAGRGLTCGIWHHGRLVGTIGLRVDPAHHSGEIGYWLAREARGQGIMTRATRAGRPRPRRSGAASHRAAVRDRQPRQLRHPGAVGVHPGGHAA